LYLTDVQELPGKVSFTFDSWTSRSGDPFLALTAHYIESSAAKPLQWELRANLIGFIPIVGNHSGLNQARHILRCIDRVHLRAKVGVKSLLECVGANLSLLDGLVYIRQRD
jgi:hypothetical protein